MQLDQLLQFLSAHQVGLGSAGGALLASWLHAKFHGRSLLARSLAAALPGFLNAPLAKKLAVDIAKAVIQAWDTPPAVTLPPAPVAGDTVQVTLK